MRRTPIRMCVACRKRRPKGELLRFLLTADGFRIDPTGKLPGRGAYVCPDRPECWQEKKLRRFAGSRARALAEALAALLGGRDGQNTHLPAG
ncbi:YlxR family protein [Thermus thermamylovorans]|uniref:YlxR family protein n=1 Tax=Thermus thermamylovorans TaxID=2509362 RepID=A0A4Q9B665_9DEIN|nr:YlxR family protein [Thermus thermamylovorans]TBH21539.1 YlxR family protein [Thermus thermamylovorans]